MEKLEVEIVAVQKDGDVLVGAPRVDKGDFVVVNKKEEPKPIINSNGPKNPDNVDIETAAGPGAGPSPAPAPTTTAQAAGLGAPPAPPLAPAPALNPVGSAIISQTVSGAGGSQPNPTMTGRAPAGTVVIGDPVNPLVITLSGPMKVAGTGTLTLTFNGVTVTKAISVTAGSTTFSILGSDLPDPKVYSVGSVAQAQVTLSLTGAIGTVTQTITLDSRPVSDPEVLAASPIRKLLDFSRLGPTELAGLDAYFYFQSKAPGNNLPTEFFSGSSVKSLSGFPASVGNTIELYPGQTFDFYAAGTVNAGLGDFSLNPTSGRSQVMIFGKRVDWGDAAANWAGLQDPLQDPNSLGYLAVANNNAYLPVYDNQNGGFFDSFDTLNQPFANFPVWDDSAGSLGSSTSLSLAPGIKKFALVAGLDGMRMRGLDLNASGATVGLWSGADLQLQAVDLRNVGLGGSTSGGLSVDAVGKVRMGADASLNLDLPTQAGAAEAQQVRLEGQTGVNALGVSAPLPGNLAVIRTGDSLELRNLTIRNFSETRLEGYTQGVSGSSVLQGRILLSGSSVRDFKIKELVGAAVNSDAKIQMMAVDDAGALSGELTVSGKMPVAGKLAQALDSSVTGTLGNTKVDAVQVDLAAKRINFQSAQLTAMNAITARAQTILLQDSFMTVVRDRGMINMFVREGVVNTTYGTVADGKLNFNGSNTFQIGNNSFSIRNQADLTTAYGNSLVDITHNGGSPQPGKVNVLKL